ncbi:hypothetical protein [Candidatus Clostridium radicumherbarum]|uniref:ATP synthase subunit I n=1 Tax=Candidatus Clostridium radicumherbarum TaxID=3381662 RepID=A0ABW8TW44_9CLOT
MFKEVSDMLKKVFFFDIFFAIILTPIVQLVFKAKAYFFLLGLFIAAINFLISSIVTRSNLLKLSNKYSALGSISNFVRVIIICIVGIIIYDNNVNNIITYMLGFTSHFLALILYGFVNLLGERK